MLLLMITACMLCLSHEENNTSNGFDQRNAHLPELHEVNENTQTETPETSTGHPFTTQDEQGHPYIIFHFMSRPKFFYLLVSDHFKFLYTVL